jgi:tripartite-type tricarboxylate transporter receptor subunit TctC
MRARFHMFAVATAAILVSASADAETPAEFFKEKQINVIVSSDVGGGFDAYARMIARHITPHMPGNPPFVVQNMPGAGGLRAANSLYSVAPKDGTTIGLVQNTVPLEPLYGNTQASFNANHFQWLGSPNQEVAVLAIWYTVPVDTIEDAKKHQLIIGASGSSSSSAFYARVFEAVFDIKIKIIAGYKGAADALLAMERGENEGNTSAYWSSLKSMRPDWIKDKKIKFVFQYGAKPHPELNGIPFALDLIKDPIRREIMDVASAPLGLGRPILGPPGIPADRVDALRKALTDTFQDTEYRAECAKLRLECDAPATGSEIAETLARAYAASPEAVRRLQQIYHAGTQN